MLCPASNEKLLCVAGLVLRNVMCKLRLQLACLSNCDSKTALLRCDRIPKRTTSYPILMPSVACCFVRGLWFRLLVAECVLLAVWHRLCVVSCVLLAVLASCVLHALHSMQIVTRSDCMMCIACCASRAMAIGCVSQASWYTMFYAACDCMLFGYPNHSRNHENGKLLKSIYACTIHWHNGGGQASSRMRTC